MTSWYVVVHHGIMTKLYTSKMHVNRLLAQKQIIEYRKCDTRQQADYFCNKYNKVEDLNNEELI